MKNRLKFFLLSTLFLLYILECFGQSSYIHKNKKIPSRKIYCDSINVTDNYRYLENLQDSSVVNWFEEQSNSFKSLINSIPQRDSMAAELFMLDKMQGEHIRDISRRGNRYFFKKSSSGQNISKLYFRDGEYGIDQLLFDPSGPNQSEKLNITFIVPSHDGVMVAFGISSGGSEMSTILIANANKKIIYRERIFPCYFGVQDWNNDNTSFYYTGHKVHDTKAEDFLLDTKLMLHKVGTEPTLDREIFSRVHNPELPIESKDIILGSYSEDHNYFLISSSGVSLTKNVFYAPASSLKDSKIKWHHLFKESDGVTGYVFANDSIFILTHKDAPNFKIIVTAANTPNLLTARTLVPHGEKNYYYIKRSKHYIFIGQSDGINKHPIAYNITSGIIKSVQSPIRGNVDIETYGIENDKCSMMITSWTQPRRLFDYDAQTGISKKSSFDRSIHYPDSDLLAFKELEVKSQDGTMVPLSIVYPKDLVLDGSTYCVLEGYGAYGESIEPEFAKLWLLFAKYHVIYAVAHVRGGGEKGESWHQGGFKQTKPNSWKDFIACAEYLVKNKYTSSDKLAAEGTSGGGITVGRAITDRPDLFGSAIIRSGECNTILFETLPVGPANVEEFGSTKNPLECGALLEMDALYHVKDGIKYPAVICTTGMNDARVIPWGPAKFVAALQNSSISGKPVVLRVEYDGGHLNENKKVTYMEMIDMYSFAFWAMGHPSFKRK
jgi:prolyl oligopeptidase